MLYLLFPPKPSFSNVNGSNGTWIILDVNKYSYDTEKVFARDMWFMQYKDMRIIGKDSTRAEEKTAGPYATYV